MSLEGKVVIITGASSGIGEATAVTLAKKGAKVVLAARRAERLSVLHQRLEESGAEALIVQTDVTQRAQVEALVAKTVEHFGRLDIVVNNAGVMLLSLMGNCRVEEWERMIDVNVKGVLYSVAAALPVMMAQKSGHIINVSSMAGRRVFQTGAVYCGTKFALNAITEGLRMELAPTAGLRFTSVAPGIVATELTDHIIDKSARDSVVPKMKSVVPLQSEDVARAVAYAASQPAHVNINEVLVLPTNQV